MARQVRNKMGWSEENTDKIVGNRAGLFSIIKNILGTNRSINQSTPYSENGCIENFARPEIAKEAETLVARAKMLQ